MTESTSRILSPLSLLLSSITLIDLISFSVVEASEHKSLHQLNNNFIIMSNQPNVRVTKPNIEVAEFRIEGFADLPANKGVDFVDSPEFSCFGHQQWCLRVWPGGHANSDD